MTLSDGTEPIDDDEILYRRVPSREEQWVEHDRPTKLVFRPREDDTAGLSATRAKYKSIEDAAQGSKPSYCVAVLRAGDLRRHGIEVKPSPLENDPGHAELPALTHASKKSHQVKDFQKLLAEKLCLRIEGPFPKNR